MNFVLKAFSEGDGSPSSMRILTALTVSVILYGWLTVTIKTGAMAPLPIEGAGGILIGALGLKAWQRSNESNPKAPNEPSP